MGKNVLFVVTLFCLSATVNVAIAQSTIVRTNSDILQIVSPVAETLLLPDGQTEYVANLELKFAEFTVWGGGIVKPDPSTLKVTITGVSASLINSLLQDVLDANWSEPLRLDQSRS